MRRKLFTAALLLVMSLTLSAKVVPAYSLFGRAGFVRGTDYTAGAGLSGGVEIGRTRLEAYVLGDYFFSPMGGNAFAGVKEFTVEPGVSVGMNMFNLGPVRGFLALDLGFFMQFGEVWQDPDAGMMMGHIGLMGRLKLMLELKYFGLGVYYQLPVFPTFEDYRGLGIIISVL